jgi:hypothetical protein
MSERGSFVTEFMYCRACAEAVKRVLDEAPQGYFEAAFPS